VDTNIIEEQAVSIFRVKVCMPKNRFGSIGSSQERSSLRFARWAKGIELGLS
jgi:hypothetical protein